MNGLEYSLTILVVSYDGYSDMWPDFFNCKTVNWPDCPFETVLANNEKDFNVEGVRVINCGKDALWSTRTRMALEQIETKYVCFMLEDFYIANKVDSQQIFDALSLMEKDSLLYYKLDSFSAIETPLYKGISYLKSIPANHKYGISLLSAIWDREFFIEKIGDGNYNPWKFEVDRNVEAEDPANTANSIVGVYDERDILNICHMVVQGKYLPEAVSFMKKNGYGFLNLDREVLHGKDLLVYRLRQAYVVAKRKMPWIRYFVDPFFKKYSVSEKYKA